MIRTVDIKLTAMVQRCLDRNPRVLTWQDLRGDTVTVTYDPAVAVPMHIATEARSLLGDTALSAKPHC